MLGQLSTHKFQPGETTSPCTCQGDEHAERTRLNLDLEVMSMLSVPA